MKKLLTAFLATVVLLAGASVFVHAFEIVLPDDEFETEVTFAPGDVNGDSEVNLNDYTLLARVINGASVIPEGDADVDGDDTISLNDYTKLARILNGAG